MRESKKPDFWQQKEKAAQTSQKISSLEEEIGIFSEPEEDSEEAA